jgi:hypothetical protein
MKNYIYSVWTKPWKREEKLFNELCVVASTELTKKIGNSVKIYTSSEDIPHFSRITTDIEYISKFDELKNTAPAKWALPKMITLNSITEPAVHIDYDVFLFKPQDDDGCDVLVQNIEKEKNFSDIYEKAFYELYKGNSAEKVDDILEYIHQNKLFGGFNCGYMDVKNIEAAKQWTAKSIVLFNLFEKFNGPYANIIVEQNTLYAFSHMNKINVKTILENNNYSETQDINKQAIEKGYCHLMSSKYYSVINSVKNINISNFNKILNYLEVNFHDAYKKFYDTLDYSAKVYFNFYEKHYR